MDKARLDSGIVEINPYSGEKRPAQFYYIDLDAVTAGELTKDVIVSRDEAPSRAQRLLNVNDILFQTVRPYQQNNYFFQKERELRTVASTGYAQLRTGNNPLYIYYSLHQDEFVREVNNRCTGSSYPAINPSELGRCSIYFETDRTLQDNIASVLAATDEAIGVSRALVEKYAAVKQGLMQDLLGKGERVKLVDVGAILISGVDKHIKPEEIPVRLCNYTDVYNNRYIVHDMPFMLGSVRPSELRRFKLRDGDVIITKDSETPNDIGIPAVVCGDIDGLVCGYHLAIIRPFQGKYDGRFVMLALQTHEAVKYFSCMANGITRYGMTIKTIENQTIYAPQDLDEQRHIADIILAADERLTTERKRLTKLVDIKRGLMEDLLSGRVRTDNLQGGI
jgi:type I restriction enzyme S subunit